MLKNMVRIKFTRTLRLGRLVEITGPTSGQNIIGQEAIRTGGSNFRIGEKQTLFIVLTCQGPGS